ncbi:kinesin-like protein kin-13a [Quercus suber]|uniref:Kinesin-like protein kin-13a n=1 Tax=Quercus suber TaxID=58331 RepID=A0AAW0L3C7_QUESU
MAKRAGRGLETQRQQAIHIAQNCRLPPLTEVVKINFDGAMSSKDKKSGIGVVARDVNNLVLASCAKKIHQYYKAVEIESMATATTLTFVTDLGFQCIILEGDSLETADDMCLDTGYDMGSMAHDDAGPSHMCPPTSPTTSPLPTTRTSPPLTTGIAPADVHGRDEMRFMPTPGLPTPGVVPPEFVHTEFIQTPIPTPPPEASHIEGQPQRPKRTRAHPPDCGTGHGETSEGTSEEKKTGMIQEWSRINAALMPVPSLYGGSQLHQPLQPLHNNVAKIKVVVRKRPLNKKEIAKKEEDIITIEPTSNALTVHETKLKVDLTEYVEKHEFVFDAVLNEDVSNDKVYSETVEPIVPLIFHRTKATCFAYGQTGKLFREHHVTSIVICFLCTIQKFGNFHVLMLKSLKPAWKNGRNTMSSMGRTCFVLDVVSYQLYDLGCRKMMVVGLPPMCVAHQALLKLRKGAVVPGTWRPEPLKNVLFTTGKKMAY